jgi:hypothetical protein
METIFTDLTDDQLEQVTGGGVCGPQFCHPQPTGPSDPLSLVAQFLSSLVPSTHTGVTPNLSIPPVPVIGGGQ